MRSLADALRADGLLNEQVDVKVVWGRDVWITGEIVEIDTKENVFYLKTEDKIYDLVDMEVIYVYHKKSEKMYNNYKNCLPYIAFANLSNAFFGLILAIIVLYLIFYF